MTKWGVKWGVSSFFWEDVLNFDFIKEIEDKTHYRHGEHHHQQQFLVFYLRPESNKSEGGYIYLDEALEKYSVRPTFEDQVREKIWRFKFVRGSQKKNSELIRDLIVPYLKRVKTEYDIEILKCEGGTMDLEFSPDLYHSKNYQSY